MRSTLIISLVALWLNVTTTGTVGTADERQISPAAVSFTLDQPGRTSLAVFDDEGKVQHRTLLLGEWLETGEHTVTWDGLDRYGRPLPTGRFRWKLISHPGLKATFLTALGTNPKAGSWTRWPGNHYGPTCLAVGSEGVCIGAATAEGPPSIQMLEPDAKTTRWYSPHYGWSAFGPVAMAMIDEVVVFVRQDARVVQHDQMTGERIGEFDVLWKGDERAQADTALQVFDLDVDGDQIVISHFDHDAMRWYDFKGKVQREVSIAKPRGVAAGNHDAVFVLSEQAVVRITPDGKATPIVPADALVEPMALAFDEHQNTLLVANGKPDERILRFSTEGKLVKAYGVKGGRLPGPHHADRFANITDIAAAPDGSFYVVEGNSPFARFQPQNIDGLRRVVHVGANGEILYEWYGGVGFFNMAAAVPENPCEVYQNVSDSTLARYDFDPATGASKLTHLIIAPRQGWGDGLFPKPRAFPHLRPIVRNGQLYFHSQGRYLLRPDLEAGKLIPVAMAAFKRYGGWKEGETPQPMLDAAAHQGLDLNKPETDAFTWSDTNRNGELDPDEFRFAESGPGAGYAAVDGDFNLVFGHYSAPNHTYTGKNWINFAFERSLYATLPNASRESDVPVWDWNTVRRSAVQMPTDPLGVNEYLAPRSIHVANDGRIDLLVRGATHPGDIHPANWPTGNETHTRIFTAEGDRVIQILGKHASAGPPRDAQFGSPAHLLGNVGTHLIVCDRDRFTTAWTHDGLLIGTLTDQYDKDEGPPRPSGDDWMSAGSIHDLGNGEALWFAPRGSHSQAFRISGWNDLGRQSGWMKLAQQPPAASLDGDGFRAEYFANASFAGEPILQRNDPRLWFSDDSVRGNVVAAWAKDGPCPEIAAGEPFSVRWRGSFTAPYSEPFWLRVYNHRDGRGHTPLVQSWKDGHGFARVFLNDQLIVDKWMGSPLTNPWQTVPLHLEAGESYDLRVEYSFPGGEGAQFSLVWCNYTEEWMRVPTAFLHTRNVQRKRPVVSVSTARSEMDERDPGRPATVRFTLDRAAKTELSIGYRLSGVASPGEDYIQPELQVIVPAGSRNAEIEIQARDDQRLEANESCIVTLTPDARYRGDGSAGEGLLVIRDDDNVLVDDSLKLYYTFDDMDFAKVDIRNEVGPDYSGIVHRYMATLPRGEASRSGFGDAITFPYGQERVRSESELKTRNYSISFWFRTSSQSCGICQAGGVSFFLEGGRLGVINHGWTTDRPEMDLNDSRWHHVGFTWKRDDRQHRLYVDGKHVATNTGPGGNSGFAGTVQLGRSNRGGSFRGGSFDEFRIYNRSLSDEEIEMLSKFQKNN